MTDLIRSNLSKSTILFDMIPGFNKIFYIPRHILQFRVYALSPPGGSAFTAKDYTVVGEGSYVNYNVGYTHAGGYSSSFLYSAQPTYIPIAISASPGIGASAVGGDVNQNSVSASANSYVFIEDILTKQVRLTNMKYGVVGIVALR